MTQDNPPPSSRVPGPPQEEGSAKRGELEQFLNAREHEHLALNNHAVVSIADRAGRIIYANDLFCEISGYRREELLGQNHRILKSGAHPDALYREMWSTITSGRVWRGEVCNKRKDGSLYWVTSTITPFLDSDGKPYQYISIRTEITRQIEATDRLKASEKELRKAVWELGERVKESNCLNAVNSVLHNAALSDEELLTSVVTLIPPAWMVPEEICARIRYGGASFETPNFVETAWQLSAPLDLATAGPNDITVCRSLPDGPDSSDRVFLPTEHELLVLVTRQVTQALGRRHDQEALRKAQRRLHSVLENAGDAIYIHDRHGRIHDVNKVACDQTGYDRNELLALNVSQLDASLDTNALHETWEVGIADPTRYPMTLRTAHRRKDGSVFPIEVRISLLRQDDEYLFVAMVRDITERLETEARLSASEQRFAFAVEGAGDGVWDWDMRTGAMPLSGNYEGMLGYAPGEIEPTIDAWVSSVHPDDLPCAQRALQAYLANELPVYAVQLRLRCKGGGYKWILCRGAVVGRDDAGKPVRMIGIHSDISERKAAEAELVAAREAADRANQAKSDFLSSMSHELRTPMSAILGFGQILEFDDTLNEEQRDNVDEILKAGQHLLELINEVLDLAKVESGQIRLTPEPVEVWPIVDECLSLMGPLAEQRSITLSRTDQKEIVVRVDRIRFKQVLLNLLSNAIKYNRDGGRVDVLAERPAPDRVRICVRDTGIGIPAGRMAELFQPFSRLDAENGKMEGTGIGLTITRRLMGLMGGAVDVESTVGVGSTFRLDLPVDSPATTRVDEPPRSTDH